MHYFLVFVIQEILQIRNAYRALCDKVQSGNATPKSIKTELGIFRVLITDTLKLVQRVNCNVPDDYLLPYQLHFSQLITEDENFIEHFKANQHFKPTKDTMDELTKFEKSYHHLINDLILIVYNKN